MKRLLYGKWACFLLLSLLVPALFLSASRFTGLSKEPVNASVAVAGSSNANLFRQVWDITVGTKGGYSIVSDAIFPMKVYVLDLPDVTNYRFSNHSDLIEGVKNAIEIAPGESQVKKFEFTLDLWGDLVAKINVNISYVLVKDWSTYRTIIESESNAIVVNTYDEVLPVPEGYLKEAWVDKIADFMLTRFGTWVHVGGYPFYRVWLQNRTQEVWGELGFQRLMSHIGRENAACYPVGGFPEDWGHSYQIQRSIDSYLVGFQSWPDQTATECIPGYPLGEEFYNSLLFTMFPGEQETSHAAIIFSNSTSSNYGVYVHLGTWEFREAGTSGDSHVIARPAAYAGFLATAVAIYVDYSRALAELYGKKLTTSASETISDAQTQGRTIGLAEAIAQFEDSLDAYSSGQYKLAFSYALDSEEAAESAKTPAQPAIAVAFFGTVMLGAGGCVFYWQRKKSKREGI